MAPKQSAADRLWSKTVGRENPDGCWIWTGTKSRKGYGSMGLDYHKVAVHRLAYTLAKGPIPAGLEIDHLCSNRLCVNPAHLEAVTHTENLLRTKLRGRLARGCGHKSSEAEYCQRGHRIDGVKANGRRYCKMCKWARNREWRRRNSKRPLQQESEKCA